jgi:1-acyl-sn-glycerol-3-phosphate acyltransferase
MSYTYYPTPHGKRIYRFLHRIAQPLFKSLVDFEVKGQEHVPPTTGGMIMSNHVSYLDPVFLGAAVPREFNYIARDDLFEVKYFSDFIRYFNAVPIKRGKPDLKNLRNILSMLKEGKLLLMFPEGTRSSDGTLGEGLEGAGFIAYRANVPVIPVFLKGTEIILPKHAKGIKRAKVSVRFGPAVELTELRKMRRAREAYKPIAQEIMKGIAALKTSAENEV